MTIDELVEDAFSVADVKGFWDEIPINIPEKLALIHSEISEALEAWRNEENVDVTFVGEKPEGFGVELADAVIRIADLCGYLNIDLEDCIAKKMLYNKTRLYKHGKRF